MKGDIQMNIVFNIKALREKKNMSGYKLAKETGINRSYLYNLEKNKIKNPSFKVLIAISEKLEVDLKSLFYTDWDVKELEERLYLCIEKYGTTAKETIEVANIIDLLSISRIKIDKEKEKILKNCFFSNLE